MTQINPVRKGYIVFLASQLYKILRNLSMRLRHLLPISTKGGLDEYL